MKRRGFTLIELLVVIAIIAILAAILFPVFAQMKEKAQRTACISNLKQLYLAFYQYAGDNDAKFPHFSVPPLPAAQWCGIDKGWPGSSWPQQLWDYYKSSGILRCPSDMRPATSLGLTTTCWQATSAHKENMGGTSYMYSPYLGGQDPSSAPVGYYWTTAGFPPPGYPANSPGYDKYNRQILADMTAFHKGQGQHWQSVNAGFNTLMTDGHVKFYTDWYQFAYTWW